MLRLLQICLKGDAQAWSKVLEEEYRVADPPVILTWDNLRRGLEVEFVKTEDADRVWQEVQGLVQRESEPVDDYIRKFSLAWERMCKALAPQVPPPDMMKKDRFLARLGENLRWRMELKKPWTYEDALDVARNKEWKLKKICQLGVESLQKRPDFQQINSLQGRMPEVHPVPLIPVAPQVVPAVVNATVPDDGLRQEMRQVVDLMKNLNLNLLSNVGHNYDQRRNSSQPRNDGGQNGGKKWKNVPTCYNCGELGHISPQCDKPRRMGGDMYHLPTQLPNRSNDFSIEIKGDPGPSRLTVEEKGKTKVLSPSKKKGKAHEGEDVKAKRKRRARRKFHVLDFPLGEGQGNYDLREDLTTQKADVTFGQLVELVPKLKRQWKKLVNPMEKEPDKGSVRVLAIDEFLDICPIVDVWHKRKNLGQGYVDGGAQICVITQTCVERMGLAVQGVSGFRIRLANHQKVKCLGVVKSLEIEAYAVKTVVDFHVMPVGLGAYPIILGRPWLRAVNAVQDWKQGTISLCGKTGGKKLFDMNRRKPLHEESEEGEDSSEEDSCTMSEVDSDSTSSNDEDVDVAFLLMETLDEELEGIVQDEQDRSAETKSQRQAKPLQTEEAAAKVMEFLKETLEELEKRKKGAQGVPTQNTGDYTNLMKFVAQDPGKGNTHADAQHCQQRPKTVHPIWQALYKYVKRKPVKRKGTEVGASSSGEKAAKRQEKGKRKARPDEPRKEKKPKKMKTADEHKVHGLPAQTPMDAEEELRNLLGGLLPEQDEETEQTEKQVVNAQHQQELEASLQESLGAIKILTDQTRKLFQKAMEGTEGNKKELELLRKENTELKQRLEQEESNQKKTKREWNREKKQLLEELEEAKRTAGKEKERAQQSQVIVEQALLGRLVGELKSMKEGKGLWLEPAKVGHFMKNAQTLIQEQKEGLLEDLLEEMSRRNEVQDEGQEKEEDKEEQENEEDDNNDEDKGDEDEDEDDDDEDKGPSPDNDQGPGSTSKDHDLEPVKEGRDQHGGRQSGPQGKNTRQGRPGHEETSQRQAGGQHDQLEGLLREQTSEEQQRRI
ncbi:hypothetical protein L7F22_001511 [Adiantum nelumboides]|nr:hypothetical protein [Adiantum nelumboides]